MKQTRASLFEKASNLRCPLPRVLPRVLFEQYSKRRNFKSGILSALIFTRHKEAWKNLQMLRESRCTEQGIRIQYMQLED